MPRVGAPWHPAAISKFFTERIKVATLKPKMLQLVPAEFSRQIGEANAFSRHLSLSSMYLGASRRPPGAGCPSGQQTIFAPTLDLYSLIPSVSHHLKFFKGKHEYRKRRNRISRSHSLVRINHLLPADFEGEVVAKIESFNPASSVKDRVALAMVNAAEASGKLKPGGTLVESTSGNTGVALAMVGAARGYKVVITMPESMSKERRALMRAFGAELVLTPAAEGMQGTVDAAQKVVAEREGAILASQFTNPANPQAHYETTAEEIWADADGQVDAFVAGIGTGGTVTGVGSR